MRHTLYYREPDLLAYMGRVSDLWHHLPPHGVFVKVCYMDLLAALARIRISCDGERDRVSTASLGASAS